MAVFRNYNPNKAGDVNAQAFPRVGVIPWTPTQRNIRANPNIPSQPQRIQPQERGTTFPTSASGGGTLSPVMSSGCTGCGISCSGCAGSTPITATPFGPGGVPPRDPLMGTASGVSTGHAFPQTKIPFTTGPILQRNSRGTGRLRSGTSAPSAGTVARPVSLGAMRG